MKQNTWKAIEKTSLPPYANILSGTSVLSIKNNDSENELYMAKFLVQERRDKEKESLVHDFLTRQQSTL